ncbi:MAG: uracil-DNA glycosylase [Hyperionvirus sp.]|uniref:Uracil-DNA glycosylase n=1 Tax=Hyperionvirus sp. TaxID=2487770 RepID=A0A3G5AGA1_9VIRU|nr:MAG: uracil-DNA glycosylase [Hyperionvirus sp.]
MLSVKDYKYKSWKDKFPDGKVVLEFDQKSTWYGLLKEFLEGEDFDFLKECLGEEIKAGKRVYPYPELLFSAFKFTLWENLKVCILGMDPYTRFEKGIPQAMGLSFSVPVGINIPSSLSNIFNNMKKFNHIKSKPSHGNLEFLASQGCLMLNSALTVPDSETNKHVAMWKWFTDGVIEKISNEREHIIFVLWGAPALSKLKLIDQSKHDVLISSHPSGLSCGKPLKQYPAFNDADHFGNINVLLKKYNKTPLVYEL